MNSESASEKAKRQSFAFLLEWVQTEAMDIFADSIETPETLNFMNMQQIMGKMFEEFRAKSKRVKQLESRLRDRDAHIEMLEAVVTELQKQFVAQVQTNERLGTPLNTPQKGDDEDTPRDSTGGAVRRQSESAGKKHRSPSGTFVRERVDEISRRESLGLESPLMKGTADESREKQPMVSSIPMSDTRHKAKKSVPISDLADEILPQASNDTISSLSSDDSFDPLVA